MRQESPSRKNDEQNESAPDIEAVIHRARRSFGIGIFIMMAGFMAVAGALVHRFSQTSYAEQYAVQSIELPAGAEVTAAAAHDGILTLTYRTGSRNGIMLIDGRDGQVIQDVTINN